MKFAMMTIDGNCLFDACKRFLVMQLESVQKLLEMGISEEAYQEVMGMFCNHATHLYVCGMIDEEFFRVILDGIVVNDAIDMLIDDMNDIRKDIVKCTG